MTRLSGLMGSEVGSRAGDPCSFPRRGDPQVSYCVASLKKQGGETEELILYYGWVRVFYLQQVGVNGIEQSFVWPAEISPNVGLVEKHG